MTTTLPWRDTGAPASRTTPRLLLALSFAGSLLLYFALFLLLRGKSFRLSETATLERWPSLGKVSDALTPESLATATWTSEQARVHEYLYLLVAVVLVALWVLALWVVRPGARTLRLRWIVLAAAAFGLPLCVLPGMFSGDIFLYMFYGRIISEHGENPILMAPDRFPADPYLRLVYWKWLPSSYGPVWLLLSGILSALAGDGVWSNLLTYKSGVLAIHLLATVAVWKLLRDTRPELATWGAVFYGWNPLVLFETAGSGHNDVLVGLFSMLALLAVAHRRWLWAVVFLVAAAMVKLMALILLPVLVLGWLRGLPTVRERVRAGAAAAATAVASGLLMYAPLWGGTALLDNIRENPAAREYQNSLWELLILNVISPQLDPMLPIYNADLDIVRNLGLAALYAFLLLRLWKGQDMLDTITWAWFAYFLFAAWMWPWYFLQVIPIAAARGPSRTAGVVGGLTLGGMLFWLGWPDPALPAAPWFHNYRAVLLFAPAVLMAVWPARLRPTERAVGNQVPVGM